MHVNTFSYSITLFFLLLQKYFKFSPLGFPVSFCTSSLKFSTSVFMISGANMWIMRIFGLVLDIMWEPLCMAREEEGVCELLAMHV